VNVRARASNRESSMGYQLLERDNVRSLEHSGGLDVLRAIVNHERKRRRSLRNPSNEPTSSPLRESCRATHAFVGADVGSGCPSLAAVGNERRRDRRSSSADVMVNGSRACSSLPRERKPSLLTTNGPIPSSCPQARPFGCPVPFAIHQTRHQARPSSRVRR
jgi:hypothetical protein